MPSPASRSAALAIALFALVPAGRSDNINLPDLGDASAASISPAQERKLGEEFMRRARRSLNFVDDPELGHYIQTLGQRLVSNSDSPAREFRFYVIQDPAINAFAVPGGFIGVNTGLILAAQSEGELASVLAHETAHITQRHIPRLIAESERAALPALAAILASILIASSGHDGAEAGIAVTTATMAQRQLNFTRAFEEEADRIGMSILARSGFAPDAMPSFFERMQSLNRHNDTNLPEFLRTHPVTTNRIADARNRAEQLRVPAQPDSADFHHVRAKLRAYAPGDPAEIARGFHDNLAQQKYRHADAERYGYALALLRAKDTASARRQAALLTAQRPDALRYRILQAEVEMAAQRYPEALALYDKLHQQHANDLSLVRYYASALLKAKQPRRAYELIKPLLRKTTDEPALYRLFGTAAGEVGERAEAHQALGEYHYMSGNLPAAVQQFDIALKHVGDNFYLTSSLEARRAAIREELALQQKPR